jgi:hypothetical protein
MPAQLIFNFYISACQHALWLNVSGKLSNDMLDFYIIEDEKPKPSNPGQSNLAYAGGLDDRTFDNLQRKGIIDGRFDYYTDFRWGTELIEQIRKTIQTKRMEKDSDVQSLLVLLDIAGQQKSGLIAYAD